MRPRAAGCRASARTARGGDVGTTDRHRAHLRPALRVALPHPVAREARRRRAQRARARTSSSSPATSPTWGSGSEFETGARPDRPDRVRAQARAARATTTRATSATCTSRSCSARAASSSCARRRARARPRLERAGPRHRPHRSRALPLGRGALRRPATSSRSSRMHHHLVPVPGTGRERNIVHDAGDLLRVLANCGVDLVLCGHKHVPNVWRLEDMLIVNAGTVLHAPAPRPRAALLQRHRDPRARARARAAQGALRRRRGRRRLPRREPRATAAGGPASEHRARLEPEEAEREPRRRAHRRRALPAGRALRARRSSRSEHEVVGGRRSSAGPRRSTRPRTRRPTVCRSCARRRPRTRVARRDRALRARRGRRPLRRAGASRRPTASGSPRVALARGVAYRGADFALHAAARRRRARCTPDARRSSGPASAWARPRSRRTSRAQLKAAGRDVVVLAMGRGGPAEPELIHGEEVALTTADLLALARAGQARVERQLRGRGDEPRDDGRLPPLRRRAWRARRSSATCPKARALADALGKELLMLEGSGAAIPPVHADASLLVVGAGAGRRLRPRLLRPVPARARRPRRDRGRRGAARDARPRSTRCARRSRELRPDVPCVADDLPARSRSSRSRARASSSRRPRRRRSLPRARGAPRGSSTAARSSRSSTHLSDRARLREDLARHAGRVRHAASPSSRPRRSTSWPRRARQAGVPTVLCDNVPGRGRRARPRRAGRRARPSSRSSAAAEKGQVDDARATARPSSSPTRPTACRSARGCSRSRSWRPGCRRSRAYEIAQADPGRPARARASSASSIERLRDDGRGVPRARWRATEYARALPASCSDVCAGSIEPLIVLIGGTTGVGKSTIATEVAHRLGITRIVSTDSIREVMRGIFSQDLMPAIYESAFNAWRGLRVPVPAGRQSRHRRISRADGRRGHRA